MSCEAYAKTGHSPWTRRQTTFLTTSFRNRDPRKKTRSTGPQSSANAALLIRRQTTLLTTKFRNRDPRKRTWRTRPQSSTNAALLMRTRRVKSSWCSLYHSAIMIHPLWSWRSTLHQKNNSTKTMGYGLKPTLIKPAPPGTPSNHAKTFQDLI